MGWALLREKFANKTFVEGDNTAKFVKVFTCESFRLYGTVYTCTCTLYFLLLQVTHLLLRCGLLKSSMQLQIVCCSKVGHREYLHSSRSVCVCVCVCVCSESGAATGKSSEAASPEGQRAPSCESLCIMQCTLCVIHVQCTCTCTCIYMHVHIIQCTVCADSLTTCMFACSVCVCVCV